ncbi:hypothetical protein M422DRAFT_248678 [Sphaerobolus stellatus SS14]|nr:hypothetical protein M422DRAFT_248678 [Sphaerobolus stellatus SS14]
MNLEWEPDTRMDSPEGTLVDMVRFLEASEVEKGFIYTSFLDISEAPNDSEEGYSEFWDRIFESDNPLPYPHQMNRLKDWKTFAKQLVLHIEAGLQAITDHPCNKLLTRLRLGGGIGIFGILRALEFLRRVVRSDNMEEQLGVFFHTLKENVQELLKRTRSVFEREMLCRWTSGSLMEDAKDNTSRLVLLWHVFMEATMQKGVSDDECFGITWKTDPTIGVVDRTLQQARMRKCGCEPRYQVAQEALGEWRQTDVVRRLQDWGGKLTSAEFSASSLVENGGEYTMTTQLAGWKPSKLNPALMQRCDSRTTVKAEKSKSDKTKGDQTTRIAAQDDAVNSNSKEVLSYDDGVDSDCVEDPRPSKVSEILVQNAKRKSNVVDENIIPTPPAKASKLDRTGRKGAGVEKGKSEGQVGKPASSRNWKVKDPAVSRRPSVRLQAAKTAKVAEPSKMTEAND